MPEAIGRYALQAFLYALFAWVVGYFATSPAFRLLDENEALLRLSFVHPGKPKTDCRARTPEELAKMPPQMRAAVDCPRERSPVHVQVDLDGVAIVDGVFPPAGLSKDGASSGYWRQAIPAGPHQLKVRVNDDARRQDFPYQGAASMNVKPGQIVLIDFNVERGGVLIR